MRDAVRNRRIDRVLRQIAPHTKVIVGAGQLVGRSLGEVSPLHFHLVRRLPGANDDFTHAPHRL